MLWTVFVPLRRIEGRSCLGLGLEQQPVTERVQQPFLEFSERRFERSGCRGKLGKRIGIGEVDSWA
ncbi:MAG: hypothetical protein ACWGPN_12365, partial [Gammaproteobacteria bacterium]